MEKRGERMSLAARAKLVRSMMENRFLGSLSRAQQLAKELQKNGISECEDVVGMQASMLANEVSMSEPEQIWFEHWISAQRNRHEMKKRITFAAAPDDSTHESIDRAMVLLSRISKGDMQRTQMQPKQAAAHAAGCSHSREDKRLWAEHARIEALCGNCLGSIASMLSAMKAWKEFSQNTLGVEHVKEIPPTHQGLTAWSRLFSCAATHANYVRAVKLACLICNVSIEAFDNPALKRAKLTMQALAAPPKPRQFIRHTLLSKSAKLAKQQMHKRNSCTFWPTGSCCGCQAKP